MLRLREVEDKMTKAQDVTRTMREKEPVKYICPDCKKMIEHEEEV